MSNSIADLMRDNIKRLEQENSTLRQQLAAATERLAAAERPLPKMNAWLDTLSPVARAAFDRLVRYRMGEFMVDVWSPDDADFPPDEQRTQDRQCLCNELIDDIAKRREAANWLPPAEAEQQTQQGEK